MAWAEIFYRNNQKEHAEKEPSFSGKINIIDNFYLEDKWGARWMKRRGNRKKGITNIVNKIKEITTNPIEIKWWNNIYKFSNKMDAFF